MSSHSPLKRLRRLDRSSSEFQDQVSNILYGEEYKQWVPNIQGDDLVGLVDYLDKVRCRVSPLYPRSSHHRLSMISTPPVPLSGSVCVNSGTYAAPGRYCHFRIQFRLKIWRSVFGLLPREVLVMCTRGHSKVQGFASNALGSTPRMALSKPQR
jgi:hypothetical protein